MTDIWRNKGIWISKMCFRIPSHWFNRIMHLVNTKRCNCTTSSLCLDYLFQFKISGMAFRVSINLTYWMIIFRGIDYKYYNGVEPIGRSYRSTSWFREINYFLLNFIIPSKPSIIFLYFSLKQKNKAYFSL